MRSLIGCQALKWLLFHVISCDVHMIVFQILLLVKIFKFILKLKELSPFLSSAQNDKVLFGFIFIQNDEIFLFKSPDSTYWARPSVSPNWTRLNPINLKYFCHCGIMIRGKTVLIILKLASTVSPVFINSYIQLIVLVSTLVILLVR